MKKADTDNFIIKMRSLLNRINKTSSLIEAKNEVENCLGLLSNFEEEIETKTTVRVAWDSVSSEIAEEKNWDEMLIAEDEEENENEAFSYEEIEFDTAEEALAYIRGVDEGRAWDSPYTEIVTNEIK